MVNIWYNQVQTGQASDPSLDLFSHICRITGDDIHHYKETCEVILDDPKLGGENIKSFAKSTLGIFCMPILMCIEED